MFRSSSESVQVQNERLGMQYRLSSKSTVHLNNNPAPSEDPAFQRRIIHPYIHNSCQSGKRPHVALIIAPVIVFARSDARKAAIFAASSETGSRLSK